MTKVAKKFRKLQIKVLIGPSHLVRLLECDAMATPPLEARRLMLLIAVPQTNMPHDESLPLEVCILLPVGDALAVTEHGRINLDGPSEIRGRFEQVLQS